MQKRVDQLASALRGAGEMLRSLPALEEDLRRTCDCVINALQQGKKLLVCGNGGSATDASHFATEFVIRFVSERPSYPAIALNSDGGLLTAAGNDYGFDEIFARQIGGLGASGDVLLAISTSGNSGNILRALEEAGKRDLRTIALLGRDGGRARGLAEIQLIVPGSETARIQEGHILLLHVICDAVEAGMRS